MGVAADLAAAPPADPVDWDSVTYYYKSDDHSPREGHDDYAAWLNELNLAPIDDADALVEAAQNKHQAAFVTRRKQYVERIAHEGRAAARLPCAGGTTRRRTAR